MYLKASFLSVLVAELDVEADGKVSGQVSVLLSSIEAAAQIAVDHLQKNVEILGSGRMSTVDAVDQAGTAQQDLETALCAVISLLDVVVKMGGEIAQVHPYANAAWKTLTFVYQSVTQQQEMDDEVVKLAKTMVEVYAFVGDIEFLPQKIKPLENALNRDRQTNRRIRYLLLTEQSGRVVRTTFLTANQKKVDDFTEVLLKLKDSFDRGLAIQSASDVKKMAFMNFALVIFWIIYDVWIRTLKSGMNSTERN
ncbi:hypothetical protein B0H14DRAFT_2557432 [Mycena olivaceomarginata]|nr:hypothetical protein B0H14DRAFT_2557432 [Mycena olivaceomarginata]